MATELDGPVSTAEFHYALGEHLAQRHGPGCEEYSVVASAAKYGVPIYTSSPGDSSIGMNVAFHELMHGGTLMIDPNQDVNEICAHHPGRREERLRHSRRRIAEELLSAGATHAVGGVRHSEGRQRLLHPDHDRSSRLGRAFWCDAVRGGQLGQGQSRRSARYRGDLRRIRRSRSPCSASTPAATRTAAANARAWYTSATRWWPRSKPKRSKRARRRQRKQRASEKPCSRGARTYETRAERRTMGTLWSELGPLADESAVGPRVYADANVPAGVVAFMRVSLGWDVFFVIEHDDLRRAPDIEHYRLARQLRRTLITMDRDYLDDRGVSAARDVRGAGAVGAQSARPRSVCSSAPTAKCFDVGGRRARRTAARGDQAAGLPGVRRGARVMAAGRRRRSCRVTPAPMILLAGADLVLPNQVALRRQPAARRRSHCGGRAASHRDASRRHAG